MALEIERKFLVRGEGWRKAVSDSMRICQGYLNDEQRCSVRVRISGERAWLNIKSATIGTQRHEFEYEIPVADGEALLRDMSCKPLIEKVRYFVPVAGKLWEVDVFEGENAGLVVAELELDDPDEPFELPAWAGEEVTHDARYYNTCLSTLPFSRWPEQDRKPALA
ncbi:CYTH domain-containing protein [Methylococcus geothermalis]|uniref:CYTH domain-containing protein n=1 Tax=Methylococcus geothermalis TaxID=2681310 RepID=A0A858Q6P8_9GAMM|nr:CYTH domain-containing protein [Methylococcus geothermalis]QJD29497.1 CYTH domain-containing protein [Methylococcus geothermalis]